MADGTILMVATEPDYHDPVKIISWRDGSGVSRDYKGPKAFLAASGWTPEELAANPTFAAALANLPPMHGLSPAIGAGSVEAARYYNDLFQQMYGISMAVDADGHARPDANDRVDIGAYQARPDAGDQSMQWILGHWEVNGEDAGSQNPLTLEIDGDITIVAHAAQGFSVEASVLPSDAGTVTVSPQKPVYLAGETVTLTFTPPGPND